jgi:acetolactate synthase-1/2/3 large subunit
MRQLGDQEFDTVKTVTNFTKFAVQVNDPNKIKFYLEKAYYFATSGRPGPVWIDVPLDVQKKEIDVNALIGFEPPKDEHPELNLDLICEKLLKSKRPLIIVGNGVRLSKSVELLDKIVEKHKIPVITSLNGSDSFSNESENYFGRFGLLGQIAANKILQKSDFVLSLGSRLYVRQIGYNFKNFAKNAFKVYVDVDKSELDKPTLYPDLKINSDVNYFLSKLKDRIPPLSIGAWRKECKKKLNNNSTVLDKHKTANPLSIYGVMYKLNDYMNKDLPVVFTNGSAHVVSMQVLELKKNQRAFTNKATAPMGYGVPAAIGAYYGNKTTILCLEGDGSVHMNIQELQVISQNKLPIKLFIFNNDGYLSIKITQKNYCKGNLSLSDPSSGLTLPKYSKIADAYGISYKSVKTHKELKNVLDTVFTNEDPEIIEIFVDPNEYHEPKVMAKLDDNGNFIPGNLEDISWL